MVLYIYGAPIVHIHLKIVDNDNYIIKAWTPHEHMEVLTTSY